MKYLQSFGSYVFLNFAPPSLQSPHFILRYIFANKAIYRTEQVQKKPAAWFAAGLCVE